jgi:HAT1-interacting factor 1
MFSCPLFSSLTSSYKVEELKTTPNEAQPSAPALAAQELERELNAGIPASAKAPLAVNDLTSMVVKKKKKQRAEDAGGKRKAEDERPASPREKKAKTDT